MVYDVTVVTITRRRPHLLLRAIQSVQRQDFNGTIQHLVLIDDCTETSSALCRWSLPGNLRWLSIPRNLDDYSGPKRLARLRNMAVQMARSVWVAFLDDDNEYLPSHIESLVKCLLGTGYPAAHSYMQLMTQDGEPYLERRLPWARNPQDGRRQYDKLAKRGVFQPGSNIVRDRVDPSGHPDPVRTVDTGEWLFERDLLITHPFPTKYTLQDWEQMSTEDDKLMELLVQQRIPIACTRQATLRYYLGGYSNTFQFEE